MKILLKFWTKGKREPKIRHGTNPRVLAQRIASANFQKAFLKVVYGKDIDVDGNLVQFDNEGYYDNKKDLRQAFRAFTEK